MRTREAICCVWNCPFLTLQFVPGYDLISTRLRSVLYPGTIRFLPGYVLICTRVRIDMDPGTNRIEAKDPHFSVVRLSILKTQLPAK